MEINQPKYNHHCKDCVYLGYNLCDLYSHEKTDELPYKADYIARYGSGLNDYQMVESLNELSDFLHYSVQFTFKEHKT